MSTLEIIYLSSAALTLVSGTLILLLNPARLINRAYFGAASCCSFWLFCISQVLRAANQPIVDYTGILFWLKATNTCSALLTWLYFLIKEAILRPASTVEVLRRSALWAGGSLFLVLIVYSGYFMEDQVENGAYKRGAGYFLFLGAQAAMCAAILHDSQKDLKSRHGIQRIEIMFFAVNCCVSTLLVILMILVGSILQIPALRHAGALVIFLSFSLSLWAVCYYRVFDAKQILGVLGQRTLLLGGLGTAAASLFVTSQNFVQRPWDIFFAFVVCGGAAIAADRPLKRLLGLDSSRELRNARQTIIDWTRTESDDQRLQSRFSGILAEHAGTEHLVVLVGLGTHFAGRNLTIDRGWAGLNPVYREGWTTPEALSRLRKIAGSDECAQFLRQNKLGALLSVPRGSPNPSMLVALGEKRSQQPYTYPQIQFLLELSELTDNILTHSRVAARNAEIERMETAATMSRGLAHDLNNLATPVSSFLLHMEGRVTLGTDEAEVLADAKHSIKVMQDYIRESLFFSRRLVPDVQPQSMLELFTATVNSTQSKARDRGVDVSVTPAQDVTFPADRALLLRLLQNLVFNGIDATPPGGRVTLSGMMVESDQVILSVCDEGPGVPADLVDRIFEPYFTTKDTGSKNRGLGLGLAISLKIGSLHGGTIHVDRAFSPGARFVVTLPRHPRPPV